jgi:peptidyl-prolyl cis-trans isomerase C
MRRPPWAREPLVHFVLLGAGLLALHHAVAPRPPAREIVVTASLLRGLRQEHLRRTGAPPSAAEEAALVERFLDDEVLHREALALGLDRGDVIVRRRLVQKMRLLTEDMTPVPAPTEADLQAWLDAHPERAARPARVTLTHVFVDGERGEDGPREAAALRARLLAGEDPARLGDPFLHGRELRARTERELAALFGPRFAAHAVRLPPGEWSGPLPSSYGLHLVRVSEQLPAGPAPLAEIRAEVEREWRAVRRDEASREALARLRAGYTVRFEDGGEPAAALATR